jgi:PIN domain nuclease of toxin-antitoxin system
MILLDTHAWIWWAASPARLSARARAAIEAAGEIAVSAISVWEVATLVARRRLELDRETLVWVRQALALPRVLLQPLTPEIAVASASLPPEFPGDSADRIISASARSLGAPVVSKDARLRALPDLRVLW